MTDLVAQMLAKVTAGTTLKADGGGGNGGHVNNVNTVMAALGMGKAGRPGTLILLANYCDDEWSRFQAERWLTRWAWLTWMKVGDRTTPVTSEQMAMLVKVALGQYTDPEAARRTGVKFLAKLVGISHQTFRKKYRAHYYRIMAEIDYLEGGAIAALTKCLG